MSIVLSASLLSKNTKKTFEITTNKNKNNAIFPTEILVNLLKRLRNLLNIRSPNMTNNSIPTNVTAIRLYLIKPVLIASEKHVIDAKKITTNQTTK